MLSRIPTIADILTAKGFESLGPVKTEGGNLELYARGHTEPGQPFMMFVVEKLSDDAGAISSMGLYLESGFENRMTAERIYQQNWFEIRDFLGDITDDYTEGNSDKDGVDYYAQHTWNNETFGVCVLFQDIRNVGKVIDFLQAHFPVRPQWTNPLPPEMRDFLVDDEEAGMTDGAIRRLTSLRVAALPETVRARIDTPFLEHHDKPKPVVLSLVKSDLG